MFNIKNENKMDEKKEKSTPRSSVRTKLVRNRSGHRVELVFNGEVVVFLPGKITEVPMDFDIPSGLGLYVR